MRCRKFSLLARISASLSIARIAGTLISQVGSPLHAFLAEFTRNPCRLPAEPLRESEEHADHPRLGRRARRTPAAICRERHVPSGHVGATEPRRLPHREAPRALPGILGRRLRSHATDHSSQPATARAAPRTAVLPERDPARARRESVLGGSLSAVPASRRPSEASRERPQLRAATSAPRRRGRHLLPLRAADPVLVPARRPRRVAQLHAPQRLARTDARHHAPRDRLALRRARATADDLLRERSGALQVAGSVSRHLGARFPASPRRADHARRSRLTARLREPAAEADSLHADDRREHHATPAAAPGCTSARRCSPRKRACGGTTKPAA